MPEHKVEKHAPPPQTAFLISWQSDAIWYGRNSGWRYKSATGLLHITRIHIYLYFNLFSQALPRLNQGNFKSGFQSKRHIHDCLTLPPPAVKRRQLDFSRKQDGSLFKCAKAQYWYFYSWLIWMFTGFLCILLIFKVGPQEE